MTALELEQQIRTEIPAIRNFSFSIESLSDLSISVQAPLSEHRNHKGTAFGGSIYQILLIASYGLLFHILRQQNFTTKNFVIANAQVNYKKPIHKDFVAISSVEIEKVTALTNDLKAKGKASITLSSSIALDGRTSATLESQFVVFN